MKIDIEKINQVCGSEVFNSEDFDKTRLEWFKPQDRHDSELREYEINLLTKKIEIALLRAYKQGITADNSGSNGESCIGVDYTYPEGFSIDILFSEKSLINLPLTDSRRNSFSGNFNPVRLQVIHIDKSGAIFKETTESLSNVILESLDEDKLKS